MQVRTTNDEPHMLSKKTPVTPSGEIPKAVYENLHLLLDSQPGRSTHKTLKLPLFFSSPVKYQLLFLMKIYQMDKSNNRCNIKARRQYVKSHTAAEIGMPKQNTKDNSSGGSNQKKAIYNCFRNTEINKLVQLIQDI